MIPRLARLARLAGLAPIALALMAAAPAARGADTTHAAPSGHPGSGGRPASRSAPPAEPRAAPRVGLAITTPTTRGQWTMRVTNDDDQPVRVVADARLLTLEVTPRGARSPVRCDLPDDMRSSSDVDRALVLLPTHAYAETFEPRLYCFGAGKLDALAPGAIVVAHLGFAVAGATRGATAPPFEVSAVEGSEADLAPLKSLDAPPVALPDEPTAWAVPATFGKGTPEADTPRLSLQGPISVDAESANEIGIPLTLRNDGAHTTAVRFRPEVLDFDIIGPGGVEHCSWPAVPAAALREMFTTLPPKGSETLEVTLGSYCTRQGLDQAGLVVVWPRLDTRNASGASLGLRSFDGQVDATRPTIVRLHRGAAPPWMLKRTSPQGRGTDDN